MLAAKQRMQGWLTLPQSLSPTLPDSAIRQDFLVVRKGKHRKSDIRELSNRFKNLG
jgi:hypothetical protein